MIMRLKLLVLGIILSFLFAACNKDEELTFDPAVKISFSTDSILFDTVFTNIGSTSRQVKVFNTNLKAINLEHIKLSGGPSSPFSINVNGQAAADIFNLKINGNDSINVYIKVNINPTLENLPFIVQDSILFYFNGKKQSIPIVAYGQNAIFLNGETISTNTVWDSKLPYIVYKSLTVAENTSLTINPGTKVLFHGTSTLSVKGTLTANGTVTDSILFASDRLERIYADEPAQWNGIHFYGSSKNSVINYAVIKNAIAGITADSLSVNANPKLLLSNTIVKNMQVVGFLGYHTTLSAFNNLFFNCGQYMIYGIGGGTYQLKQNTFGAYNFNFPRKTPAVYFSDFINAIEFSGLNIDLVNNIIWGNLEEELLIEKKSSAISVIDLRNNLIKTKLQTYAGNGNILNVDPQFLNPRQGIFTLYSSSPVINKGLNLTTDPNYPSILSRDLANKLRIFPSELGCYENN